jgi:hypothetical protein
MQNENSGGEQHLPKKVPVGWQTSGEAPKLIQLSLSFAVRLPHTKIPPHIISQFINIV